jgi:SAM-dependent methyltransferase
MAVHHIQNLEHFFGQIQRALKPGALFVMSEFVGPTQFQWTDLQMRLADDLLRTIPREYRRSLQSGHIKVRTSRQTVEQMNAIDPTEAVRSADIIPVMWQYFDVVEQVDFGGTLLNLVLEEIAGNFLDSPQDIRLLERLFAAERRLLRSSAIPSDFTVLVGRVRAVADRV